MPVILPSLQDPTDLVVQGLQLSIPDEPYQWESYWSPLISDPPDRLPNVVFSQVTLPYETGMMEISTRRFSARVSNSAIGHGIRANACVCTPTGATIPVQLGQQLGLKNDIGQTTVQFLLSGITKDDTGAPLGNCRVVVFETARLQIDGAPIVVETVSDGSGNYAVIVPMNTAYQAIAYKPGSPDVAGITRNDLVPVANG